MSAKPKLSPAAWAEVRAAWENDPREGYAWLIKTLNLPVSAPAIRKVSMRDVWTKQGFAEAACTSELVKKEEVKALEAPADEESTMVSDTASMEKDHPDDELVQSSMPNPVGRPTAFKEDYVRQVYELCLLGATDAQLANFFQVAESTINLWKLKYHEFSESLKRGKLIADAEVAYSLHQRATGYSHPDVHVSNYQGEITVTEITKHYPPDTVAAIFWLKNRQPHDWKDKVVVKEEVNLNTFPSKEELKEIFDASMKRSMEREAKIANRRERLGIVIDMHRDDD